MLPDDVLLEIFYFYVGGDQRIQAWQSLVHVCIRWRGVVFGSPNRLNLRLVCSTQTHARDTLDVWPALPLLIQGRVYLEKCLDNAIALLERSDLVRVINLTGISSSHLETLSAEMQKPFPELTRLELWSYGDVVLPDSFLGGSAPRLQFLDFDGIPFLGLPKLLLSATHLVNLRLYNIPHSGYFSPEAMVTALSKLTNLENLILGFLSPLSRPDRVTRHPPPPTRSVLSVLTYFWFKGDSEYLDDLVAHIDAPRLHVLHINLFNQIVFYTPQLIQFICRSRRLKSPKKADVTFDGGAASVDLSSLTPDYGAVNVMISCKELDWQVSSLEQVCTSSLPPLSMLEDLYIYEGSSSRAHWQDNIENALWLELLRPFSAVKNLYLSKDSALRIVPALKELAGDWATELLPALQTISLEGLQPSGLVQEGIRQFLAARPFTIHPIEILNWHRR
jgi:hypothetical protein